MILIEEGKGLAITSDELYETGAYFGHLRRYWHPKFAPYILPRKGPLDIIDLDKSVQMVQPACEFIESVASQGGKVLFVCTKRAATSVIEEEAVRAGMPYLTKRWLGGLMTNWREIRGSVERMKDLEVQIELSQQESASRATRMTNQELRRAQRRLNSLQLTYNGIRDINGIPDALFVVDIVREHIAVAEAKKVGIPVVALVDSNGDPTSVEYPIPCNDDTAKAIRLIAHAIGDACLAGAKRSSPARQGDVAEPVVTRVSA